MEDACSIIENVVNEEMRTRERLPLEWAGVPSSKSDEPIWRANFAASNLYEGAKEGVGFHSDRLTTLGPYPTIASLSLGKLFVDKRLRSHPPANPNTSQEPQGYFAFATSFPWTRKRSVLHGRTTYLSHIIQ